MAPFPPPRLLSRRQAADYLGVSLEWVRDRLAEGSISHYKLGRLVKISEADLLDYLQRTRRTITGGDL